MELTFIGWVSDLARAHTKPLAAVARTEGLTGDDAVDAVQSAFETFLGSPSRGNWWATPTIPAR